MVCCEPTTHPRRNSEVYTLLYLWAGEKSIQETTQNNLTSSFTLGESQDLVTGLSPRKLKQVVEEHR